VSPVIELPFDGMTHVSQMNYVFERSGQANPFAAASDFGTQVSCAEKGESIEMPFVVPHLEAPRKHVLDAVTVGRIHLPPRDKTATRPFIKIL